MLMTNKKQTNTSATSESVAPELLELLVCPLTKEQLKYDKKNNELISKGAGLAYQIKNGIPVMLVDEARKL